MKQLNEVKRMQQLAGIITEIKIVDPVNSLQALIGKNKIEIINNIQDYYGDDDGEVIPYNTIFDINNDVVKLNINGDIFDDVILSTNKEYLEGEAPEEDPSPIFKFNNGEILYITSIY